MDLFAQNLRDHAARLGLSHAEVARRCGLSERRYAHYVSGMREPDLQTLVRIATTLGTSPDVLLGVKAGPPDTPRGVMLSKIIVSAARLADAELSSVAIQLEALAATKRTGKID